MIVKNLNFGGTAREQVFKGIEKLTNAVSSTLGASGKCVILEDANGKPIITKDGVTVADSIILLDPVENIGARRLHTIIEKVLDEISFTATDRGGEKIIIDKNYITKNLGELAKDTDLSKFIL